ncbi:hypothetical protein [Staphylococcus hyicus]|uniref:hypothetical protein n=1 Tax=Staphylococcus hyicus TaxID=1284 RepID=UPI001304A377|nr:hypothetical protein [Staphylococcus hyicus]NJH82552.1 hypothetical protein [Staphylococcus hyicus]
MNPQQSNELSAREKALYAQVQDQIALIIDLRAALIEMNEKYAQAKQDNAALEKQLKEK